MPDISVRNEEIRTTREVARELGSILAQLNNGSVQKIIIMQGKTMKGVMLSVDEYSRLSGLPSTH